ncbi:MAG: hypothetical protein RL026_1160 [Pseudomonadota bacterium]|jgi:hypothetical protein
MSQRYYEILTRYPAVTAEGKPCEILERVTYERGPEDRIVNRRFDLRTGERVRHVGGDEFVDDLSGEPLRRLPT